MKDLFQINRVEEEYDSIDGEEENISEYIQEIE